MRTGLLVLAIVMMGLSLPGRAQGSGAATSALPRAEIAVDMLSDKGGVDLNPYFEHMVGALNGRWQPLVSSAEGSLTGRPEETVIGITILPDGHLGAMRVNAPAHDEALNKAAWTAVKEMHFAPLPGGMKDAALKLRLHFRVR